MADLVMGSMDRLIPKLFKLLQQEYNLQTSVKESINKLTKELEATQTALRKVAQVPWDQLDEQVKLWAREVREASYDMEDILDIYLVDVQGRDSTKEVFIKRLGEKMANLLKKSKARREISIGIKDIMAHLNEVMERCSRYKVQDIVAKPTTMSAIDPRLGAMYNKVKNLVGISKSSSDLISMLQDKTPERVDVHNTKMKIVSIVGVGGLGKTTLAKVVYDKLKNGYGYGAFVSVGRNPDLKKVFKDILIDLDRERYIQFNTIELNVKHLIDEVQSFFFKNQKRYFIVIDDIWEVESWEKIKWAFDGDNNCECTMVITTRKFEVAQKASKVYNLQPLSHNSSKELFYARIYGDQGSHAHTESDEICDKILNKCGGIPLAIITMSSLLEDKPRYKWYDIYKTIGFGHKESNEAENDTMKVLSFSYYDLPSHLRTCLLYLSAFPEDSIIPKIPLIWKWIAEGFVHEKQGTSLFETGEGYFNDLINRSLIQGTEYDDTDISDGIINSCRVHDIVLDFICSMSREEIFFTILGNDQDIPLQSHVRRLAHHNRIIRHTQKANQFDGMQIVRSFSAQGCAIKSWVPLSSFRLLRVLAIERCNPTDGCRIRIEHVGHLVHLRYLNLLGTLIYRVPEEIGSLRFLQMLDLENCTIFKTPSISSLPQQLLCLRISFHYSITAVAEVAWLERLTYLEDLFITYMFQWKVLGVLRRLRALTAGVLVDDEKSERDFVESTSHLDMLQSLEVRGDDYDNDKRRWKATGLVLSRQLRELDVRSVTFLKLPPCINGSGLPSLTRLSLEVEDMDEKDLKNLGTLPELRILNLVPVRCSAAISNINDINVIYFPKLRYFSLMGAMVLLLANKEDRNVSFHPWDGDCDMALPLDSDNYEQKRSIPSGAASDDENMAATPRRFMPSIQNLMIHQVLHGEAAAEYLCCGNIGWEYLPSLRKISIDVHMTEKDASCQGKVENIMAALRRAADKHPYHPALRARILQDVYSRHLNKDVVIGSRLISQVPSALD